MIEPDKLTEEQSDALYESQVLEFKFIGCWRLL